MHLKHHRSKEELVVVVQSIAVHSEGLTSSRSLVVPLLSATEIKTTCNSS